MMPRPATCSGNSLPATRLADELAELEAARERICERLRQPLEDADYRKAIEALMSVDTKMESLMGKTSEDRIALDAAWTSSRRDNPQRAKAPERPDRDTDAAVRRSGAAGERFDSPRLPIDDGVCPDGGWESTWKLPQRHTRISRDLWPGSASRYRRPQVIRPSAATRLKLPLQTSKWMT